MNSSSSRLRATRSAIRVALFACLAVAIALAFSSSASALSLATHTPPPTACSVDASPDVAVRKINTTHTITVTVLTTGGSSRGKGHPKCNVPMAGVAVEVRVLTGPQAGATAVLTTDAAGKAVFNITNTQTGIEVIKFWAAGKLDITRTFWITDNGGPGPYGEHHHGVHFHAAGSNSGAMYVPTRCISRDYKLYPAFYGGTFSASSLQMDGREVDTSLSDADSYLISVESLRKGHTHTLTVTGEFATGNDVVLKAKVKRCGR